MKKESVRKKSVVKKAQTEKGFIWHSVRLSLFLTIGLLTLFFIIQIKSISISITLFLVCFVLIIFNFVVSIIHLTKYNKKTFAIVSLVISSILILFFLLLSYLFLSMIKFAINI